MAKTTIRVSDEMLDRAERLADAASARAGCLRANRSEVLRAALDLGLRELERTTTGRDNPPSGASR